MSSSQQMSVNTLAALNSNSSLGCNVDANMLPMLQKIATIAGGDYNLARAIYRTMASQGAANLAQLAASVSSTSAAAPVPASPSPAAGTEAARLPVAELTQLNDQLRRSLIQKLQERQREREQQEQAQHAQAQLSTRRASMSQVSSSVSTAQQQLLANYIRCQLSAPPSPGSAPEVAHAPAVLTTEQQIALLSAQQALKERSSNSATTAAPGPAAPTSSSSSASPLDTLLKAFNGNQALLNLKLSMLLQGTEASPPGLPPLMQQKNLASEALLMLPASVHAAAANAATKHSPTLADMMPPSSAPAATASTTAAAAAIFDKPGRECIGTFPQKLYQILEFLEEDGRQDIASFILNGTAFQIHKIDLFVEAVLKRHFKMTSFASFQRQLNFYSFQRMPCPGGTVLQEGSGVAYRHAKFLKGKPLLLQEMKRVRKAVSQSQSAAAKKETSGILDSR